MSLKLNSSGGGSVTLQEPTTASARTLNLPNVNGTVITTGDSGTVSQAMLGTGVAGTGPAFSAYASADQSVSLSTLTKVTLGAEDYDTANCFSSSRFTPNVAGYYLVSATQRCVASTALTSSNTNLYKNGSIYARIIETSSNNVTTSGSIMLYLNGTTDYIELYASIFGSGTATFSVASDSNGLYGFRMSACLVRAA